MADISASQLKSLLDASSLEVTYYPGWETRSRPYSYNRIGTLLHDTVGATEGDAPTLQVAADGWGTLPGPLYNFLIGRSGRVHVVALGRCNHAGSGGISGVESGNRQLWAIAYENAGFEVAERVSEAAYLASLELAQLLNEAVGAPANYVWGHKEWTSRKSDPWDVDMDAFRQQITTGEVPSMSITLPDNRDAYIKRVQTAVGTKADGDPGPATAAAAEALRTKHDEYAQSVRDLTDLVASQQDTVAKLNARIQQLETQPLGVDEVWIREDQVYEYVAALRLDEFFELLNR